MGNITLDVAGLARIRVAMPPPRLEVRLRRDMGEHLRADGGQETADMLVAPAPLGDRMRVLARTQGPGAQFVLALDRDGARAVATADRGRITTAIVPGREIQVLYDPARAGDRRVYGLIQQALQIVLRQRGAALVHAACLARAGRTVMLVGPRGSGKTATVLALLEQGWAYLADDKLVLAGGKAHPYETWIGVRDWHLDVLPWLSARLPPGVRRRKSPMRRRVRAGLRSVGRGYLGKRLVGPWEARFNPAENVAVNRLFPCVDILDPRRVDTVIYLDPAGTGGQPRDLGPRETERLLQAVQQMGAQDWHPLPELLASFCDVPEAFAPAFRMTDHLPGTAAIRLSLDTLWETSDAMDSLLARRLG